VNNGVGGAILGGFLGLKKGTVHSVFMLSTGVGAIAIANAFIVSSFKRYVDETDAYPVLLGKKLNKKSTEA
jgi:hypothetical protein